MFKQKMTMLCLFAGLLGTPILANETKQTNPVAQFPFVKVVGLTTMGLGLTAIAAWIVTDLERKSVEKTYFGITNGRYGGTSLSTKRELKRIQKEHARGNYLSSYVGYLSASALEDFQKAGEKEKEVVKALNS
jgi:hypothetical protein